MVTAINLSVYRTINMNLNIYILRFNRMDNIVISVHGYYRFLKTLFFKYTHMNRSLISLEYFTIINYFVINVYYYMALREPY